MASKKPSRSLVTPEFRMSFPHIHAPHAYTEDGGAVGIPAYQVEGLFTPESLASFHIYDESNGKYVDVGLPQLLVSLAQEAWGSDLDVAALFNNQRNKHGEPGKGWPIKNGDTVKARLEARGKKADHYAGMRCIRMHSATKKRDGTLIQPPIVSMQTEGGKFRTLKRDNEVDMHKMEAVFAGGNYGFATISIIAAKIDGTAYLTPYLNGIRYTRDGDRIGGQSEMDRFSGYSGGAAAVDPTAGMPDAF